MAWRLGHGGQSRRSFLDLIRRAGMGAAAVTVLPPSGLFGQGEPSRERLIVRSARPQDLETPPHLLDSWITPNELFYVRSHFYTPSIDEAAWRLVVDGDVDTPLTLTLADIRRAPSTTMVVTLECAGNGRAFFEPPVAGVQWEKGAVGTARWTGVRLRDLLRTAGVKPTARFLWLDGADIGVGRAPDFIRSLPMEKAIDPDTLLAYEMNGQGLPVSHGFPLRTIVPGWEGAYSVKWLTHLRASDRDHDGAFVQSGYRYPRRPVPPGATVSAADMEPLKGMVVKSVITSPAVAEMTRGPVRVTGFAWAGEDEIAGVDVSTDGGRTWQRARLGADRARYAWRQFEHAWRPAGPGSYVVLSRARDTRGRLQPVVPDWNPAGYLWNAIDRVRVDVQPGPGIASGMGKGVGGNGVDVNAAGKNVLDSRCLACHDMELIAQQRLTITGWTREVDKMIGWGAGVTDAEKGSLIQHLADRFGPGR